MDNFEIKMDNDTLEKLLRNNELLRNKNINTIIQIINKISNNIIISIDGKWGTGKTVLVKQLAFLINSSKSQEYSEIDIDELKKIQNECLVVYYNAWANDFHENALSSIMYKIINDFPNQKETICGDNINPISIVDFVKNISKDGIDFSKIKSLSDLVRNIQTEEEKKNSLYALFNSIIREEKKEKLVIIIDELDRCKPSFAVEMLETIKHFINGENIIFIVSTNNEQLSKMVSKLYGEKFNGYEYLNKFYDFVLTLSNNDTIKYLRQRHQYYKGDYYSSEVPITIMEAKQFSFREINRYVSSLNLIKGYLNNYNRYYIEDFFYKIFFAPYALALKIEDIVKFNSFIDGDGKEELHKFLENNQNVKELLYELCTDASDKTKVTNNEEAVTYILNLYTEINKNDDNENSKKKFLFRAISLMGLNISINE